VGVSVYTWFSSVEIYLLSHRKLTAGLRDVLLLRLSFNDSRQTNYLKIYLVELRQIFRVDRTMAEGDQSEISLSIPQWTLPLQPNIFCFNT